MAVAIPIIVILVLAVATTIVLAANRQRGDNGLAVARDAPPRHERATPPAGAELSTSTELETTGRERADETRATLRERARDARPRRRRRVGAGRRGGARRHPPAVPQPGPRLSVVGFSLAGFGAACLAFLWPTGSSGFGGKITAGKLSDIIAYVQSHAAPFYVPEARTYVAAVPAGRPRRPRRRSTAPITYAGMEQGFVALYQRCVHLGCRVPWCQTLAVVRVPVPRLEVQPRRREEGRPGAPRPRPLRAHRERRPDDHQHRRHRARPADRHQHDRTATGRPALRLISTHRREPEAMDAAWSVS